MSDHVALRAGVPPFYVMDVWLAAAERQRSHGDLVNLSAGQPSAGAPEPVRAATHLRIGRLLVMRTPPEKQEETIFEIVNQLNRGAAVITSPD